MTMPTPPADVTSASNGFPFKQYVWEHNINFVHYAGSYAIPVAYDIADDKLYALLDQLNGFYFTGGPLNLFDPDGNPHTYYQTCKKIYRYALRQKDHKGIDWPIFGICQGF